jgi:hypothetical protein
VGEGGEGERREDELVKRGQSNFPVMLRIPEVVSEKLL